MFGIVVVTHGQLAREMVAAAEMIIGELPNVTAVSIGWHESPEEAEKEIENAISRVEDGSGTVLLTDMFGGTPTNLSLSLLEKDRLEVVTGVNLPMLIRIASLGEDAQTMGLHDVAAQACSQGKESIYLASDLLASKSGK